MAFGSNLSWNEEAIRDYFNVCYSYNSINIILNLYHDISLAFQLLKEDSGVQVWGENRPCLTKISIRDQSDWD